MCGQVSGRVSATKLLPGGSLCILWKRLRGSPHESDSEKPPAGPRVHPAPSTLAAECPPSWELSLPQPPPSVAPLDAREAGRLLGHPGDCNCGCVEGEWHRPRRCSLSDRPLQHWSCSTWRGTAGSEHDKAQARAQDGCRLHKVHKRGRLRSRESQDPQRSSLPALKR